MAEVDPDALRTDAHDSWQVWSGKLADAKGRIDDLTYSRPDFSLIPGSGDVYAAFTTATTTLRDYIETGEEIFEGFARALLDTAIEYMQAEGDAQSEIDAVERELEAL
ncbi:MULTISPECIES: hypothetical protein [unclassified Microbacterium]|uniref:hypothetical protein n=1 Tax=unclassified Microbacterium TaxID=2609290 RepID=UPI00214A99F9|nr:MULTISPECIES: hypothetical protein [unclassified Microbacterium]MCR2784676.1 hypothetical protein [Microbacterium sp. zg.B96]MDL5352873.1 hypothetical protein [Microbacterium sp. zg-YB36]WIM16217.1 hypothetical protein QNO11_00875 [Microbacterium sp. zg-B96]